MSCKIIKAHCVLARNQMHASSKELVIISERKERDQLSLADTTQLTGRGHSRIELNFGPTEK